MRAISGLGHALCYNTLNLSQGGVFLTCLVCSTAGAADWSDTSVGYRYVSAQSEPGVTDKVAKNVLNFTHVSGDKMGTNFVTIDLLKSGTKDPNNGGAAEAQEWYGFYKRSFH
jgi:hypothetical protein